MKWADKRTERGQIEAIIEPIISGGVSEYELNNVISNIIRWKEGRWT